MEVVKAEPLDISEIVGKNGFCPNCTSVDVVRRANRKGVFEVVSETVLNRALPLPGLPSQVLPLLTDPQTDTSRGGLNPFRAATA